LRSVAANIFYEMVLAIEYAGGLSRFCGFGAADELACLLLALDLKKEEYVIRFLQAAPNLYQPQACAAVGFLMRGKDSPPTCEVCDAIAAEQVRHRHLPWEN
jgi:hypothetical protein